MLDVPQIQPQTTVCVVHHLPLARFQGPTDKGLGSARYLAGLATFFTLNVAVPSLTVSLPSALRSLPVSKSKRLVTVISPGSSLLGVTLTFSLTTATFFPSSVAISVSVPLPFMVTS